MHVVIIISRSTLILSSCRTWDRKRCSFSQRII